MNTVGIIAEYNPFHSGHAYHIKQAKQQSGSDYAVVIMSGNFVQRGAPAIADKDVRTSMALQGGADLVFELPACAASASAETFARTGVSLLARSGIINSLAFGCETENLPALRFLAEFFAAEPDSYREALHTCLKQGETFPAARAKAAVKILDMQRSGSDEFPASPDKIPAGQAVRADEILAAPNNILAIEYLKAIRQTGADLQPVLIKRRGNYHAKDLKLFGTDTAHGTPSAEYSSASAIRAEILEAYKGTGDIPVYERLLHKVIPEKSLTPLLRYLAEFPPLSENDFSALLHYQLIRQFSHPVSGEATDPAKERGNEKQASDAALLHRMENLLESYTTFTDFAELVKTKNRTYTAVSRALIRIMLGIDARCEEALRKEQYAPYLRVLGFKKSAAPLLKKLRRADIPVLMKPAGEESSLNPAQRLLLNTDIRAAHIYRSVLTAGTGKTMQNEYRRPLIILP